MIEYWPNYMFWVVVWVGLLITGAALIATWMEASLHPSTATWRERIGGVIGAMILAFVAANGIAWLTQTDDTQDRLTPVCDIHVQVAEIKHDIDLPEVCR